MVTYASVTGHYPRDPEISDFGAGFMIASLTDLARLIKPRQENHRAGVCRGQDAKSLRFLSVCSLALLTWTLWVLTPPAWAHHSFASSFEGSRRITLSGVVSKVEWANPHMYFSLTVKTSDGRVANWICQAAGPNTLARLGWARDLIKVGDMVTVIAYPARGGSPVASAREVILSDGRKMLAGSEYDGGPQP